MGNGEEQEEDAQRESALAANPLLQPGFKPSKVSQAQLDKLRELHNRRLQIKEKTTNKPKNKGNANRIVNSHQEDLPKDCSRVVSASSIIEDSNIFMSKEKTCLEDTGPTLVPKKRRKLHWGLDTKERWERKANM